MGVKKAYFLDAGYIIRKGKAYIEITVKTKKKATRLYYRYDPYFLVDAPEDKREAIEMMEGFVKGESVSPAEVRETEVVLAGEKKKLLKVICKKPSDVPVLKGMLPFKCYEYAIPFAKRFIFDFQLVPNCVIKYERKGKLITKITGTGDEKAELKKLAFDIETYNPLGMPREKKDPVIMISYCGKNKGVITTKKSNEKYVETVGSEKELIERFSEIVEKENPDVIFGYNSANFDIPYLEARARTANARFSMGRWEPSFRKIRKGMINGIEINGRTHIDLYPIIRFFGFIGVVKATNFTLDAVASDVLGKGKVEINKEEMWKLWDGDEVDKLAFYSLTDSELTAELGERYLPIEVELSTLTRMPLFDTGLSTSGQLVENLLIYNAVKNRMVIPPKPAGEAVGERINNPIQGAFVKLPEPGIYDNIAVMDFRGLYPSIIVAYNIDPDTLTEKKGKNTVQSPTGAVFRTKPKGLVPSVLDYLIDFRVKLKRKLKLLDPDSDEYVRIAARSQAVKILSNSFYGYLGYARSRWYSRKCAESVTAFGRKHIQETIDAAEKKGFEVLYGDSLPYDRYICIKDPKGKINIIKIGDFVRKNKTSKNIREFETLAYDRGKVIFKPILRAIEHKYDCKKKGDLIEFTTTHGKTAVTPQHSVYYVDKQDGKIKLTDAKKLKKGDFLVSLTNPKLPETAGGNMIDILDMDFGPYQDKLRVYEDLIKFPAGGRKKCPYCKKEFSSLYSHVSSKHKCRKLTIKNAKKTNHQFVGGENAKTGRIARFWKVDKELAWIMGYYCADSSISERTEKHDKVMMSFGSQNKSSTKRVKKYFDQYSCEKFAIIKNYDKRTGKNMYYYRIQCMPIAALFKYGFGLGNKSSGKKVPPLVYSASDEIKKAFVDGYLAGDGSNKKDKRYQTNFIKFTTKSKELAIGLQILLKSLKHGKNKFGKKIEHVYWHYGVDKPGIQTLRVQGIKREKTKFNNLTPAKIKEIREISGERTVFDLEVSGVHNFVDAEGLILVHNTDSVFLIYKDKKKVVDFVAEVNRSLPGKMELELEGFYPRGVFVSKKTGEERGAKKKYAMISEEGRIKIRGFELVRRDWSKIAKDTQKKVLEAILKEGSRDKAVRIVKESIERLKSGEVPMEELVIITQLNKDPREGYEVKSPELHAAKVLMKEGKPVERGSIISYVITRKGSSISEKAVPVEMAKDYDADYYINNQILPAVMKILKELGYDEYGLKVGGQQKGLDSFF